MLFLIVGRCDKHTVESECEPWHRLIGKHCQWKVHSAVSIQTQCCKNRANTSAVVSFLTHKLMSFQTATDEVSSFHYYAARTANRMFCLLLSSRLCTYCQPTLLYVASDACGERCGSVDIATRCKRLRIDTHTYISGAQIWALDKNCIQSSFFIFVWLVRVGSRFFFTEGLL